MNKKRVLRFLQDSFSFYFLPFTFFPFGDDVFAVFAAFFGAAFPFAEDVFPFPFAEAFTFASFLFPLSFFAPLPLVGGATNLSTVQPTLTETTSSPGLTSTTTSPFVAARLRSPATSSRVDFGAPLVRWIVAMWLGLSTTTPARRSFSGRSQAMTPLP